MRYAFLSKKMVSSGSEGTIFLAKKMYLVPKSLRW